MANGKYNIEQIRKYLNRELDARAMYELERQAHADPFLWDMIKGMESGTGDDQTQLKAIDQLIKERIKKDGKRVIPLWKPLSIAASILIALGIGGWLFIHQPQKPVVAINEPQVQQPDQLKVDTPAAAKPMLPKGSPMVAMTDRHDQKATTVRSASRPASGSTVLLPDTNYESKVAVNRVDTSLFVKKGLASAIAKNIDKQPALSEISIRGKFLKETSIKPDTFSRTLIGKAAGVKVDDGFMNGGIPLKKVDPVLAQRLLPLYIIDGIPVTDFKPGSIKPSDIKNITEIKDSAATKIYGSRASNGIIAINTKKGAAADNSGYMYKNAETPVAAGRVETKSRNKLDSAYKDLSKALAGAVNSNIVKGKVVDKDGREPLPGVSVTVTGTTKATQTDLNGNFIISLPTGKELLSIAYIGYNSQQVKAKSRDSLNIALTANSASLNEVVVTGYGTKKEEPAEVTDAAPALGWKAYDKYLKEGATMPDGRTGVVKLSVTVSGNGTITDIRVVKGLSDDINQKAIKLIKYGPAWTPESDHKPQQITVRIKFHK